MISINCDVGEGMNNGNIFMPYITSCSVACGGHAGDQVSMEKVVDLAIENNVLIGAHPSYPDKENFGRKSLHIDTEELVKSIQEQINSLKTIVEKKGQHLDHIKAHGALYNDLMKNWKLATNYLEALSPFMPIKIYAPHISAKARLASSKGIIVVNEAFADRNYNDDLSLVSRSNSKALITSTQEVIEHVTRIKDLNEVLTLTGNRVVIKADTYCVHSDSPNAIENVKALYEHFSD